MDPAPAPALALVLLAGGIGCATTPPHPLLYPNLHYQRGGQAQVQSDIAYCEALAQQYVRETKGTGRGTADQTAIGAAAGGALGAAGGAIGGNAAEGAAIGAAVGAGAGLLHGLYEQGEPNPNYEQFVDRCLDRRGYEVYGWSD
jgi:outer membrane lipoprotein SlyB